MGGVFINLLQYQVAILDPTAAVPFAIGLRQSRVKPASAEKRRRVPQQRRGEPRTRPKILVRPRWNL